MGVKTPAKDYTETFELIFDSVNASQISNQSQMSTMTGKMTFTLYDKSKSDLKFSKDASFYAIVGLILTIGYIILTK